MNAKDVFQLALDALNTCEINHDACGMDSGYGFDDEVVASAIKSITEAIALPNQVNEQIAKLDKENLDLHRKLASAELSATLGWQRYESANRARNLAEAKISELSSALRSEGPAAQRDELIATLIQITLMDVTCDRALIWNTANDAITKVTESQS
jgi:hypothetical protein